MLEVIAHYREGIQIKISLRKKQSLGWLSDIEFPLSFLHGDRMIYYAGIVCLTVHKSFASKGSFGVESFYWGFIT